MGRRVGRRLDQVVSFSKHGAVADKDGADRNFSDGGSAAGLRERTLHVVDIVVLTGR
jgi:hypothetical protein